MTEMPDPVEVQRIVRQDQVGAAMRVWAETLAAAVEQLVKAGFSREESVAIGTQWVAMVIAHNLGAGRVA